VVSPRLVGRRHEVERLRSCLAVLGDGQGDALIVAGEAGMGKSRLVREVLAGCGGSVFTGRTGSGGVPLRPLVEIALAASRAGADLDDPAVSAFRPALGALLPVPERAGPSAGGSPLVLAEGLLRLLATCRPRSVAIVVEDLHWADADTLVAVEYLADHAAQAGLLFVATLRTEEAGPAADLVAALAARRCAQLIDLDRLNTDELTELVLACLDAATVPPSLVEFLERVTEGRPFFVEEVLAGLIDDGALLVDDGGVWRFDGRPQARVPGTHVAAVGRRLARYGTEVVSALQAASVLGREFDAALLPVMTGLDRGTVGRALRAGVEAHLLGPVPGDEHRLRFRHALSGEAVRLAMVATEQAAWAAAALDAIEALHPGIPDPWCGDAARLAVQAGQRDRAAVLLTRAGRDACRRGALASAAALLEQAAAQAVGDLDRTAAAEEALTEVLALAGDVERALAVGYRLLRTLEAAHAGSTRQVEARLAVARAAVSAGRLAEAGAVLDRAQAALDSEPPGGGESQRAGIDALRALVEINAGRGAEAAAYAANAVAVAERAGRPAAACEALEVLGRLARGADDLAGAARLFDRAQLVAERHGLRLWRARALHEVATADFLATLRLDGLDTARTAALEAAAAGLVAAIDLHLSAIHGVRFEPDEALVAGRRSVEASTRLGLVSQAAFGWVCVAQAHAVAGRRGDTESAARQARQLGGGDELEAYLWGQCLALLSLVSEDRPRAIAELERSMRHVRAGGGAVSAAPYRGLWSLLATLDGDDRTGADARHQAAAPDALAHTVVRGLLGYAEAIAAGRAGDGRLALAGYERGEAQFARLDRTQGYHQLGRRLLAEAALADGWGDPAGWLTEAHDWFAGHSLDLVAGACRGLLRRAGVPQRRRGRGDTPVPPALDRLGVTSREADVLDLLAQGLTNPDIARRLYLSPRTVKTHVEHLLAKTELTSRVQLAALAVAEGLGTAADRPVARP
jgi:DNA-binding NarL/FixJ family response regulator